MLDVNGNHVIGTLSVCVVVGPSVVKRKEDVSLPFKTVGDAFDFFQNPKAIAIVALRLEIIKRSEFCLHGFAALTPNDRVSSLEITL